MFVFFIIEHLILIAYIIYYLYFFFFLNFELVFEYILDLYGLEFRILLFSESA